MRFQIRIVAALAVLFAFHVAASAPAAARIRSLDSGQPRELINHPVCSSAEELDDPGSCDFAQRT